MGEVRLRYAGSRAGVLGTLCPAPGQSSVDGVVLDDFALVLLGNVVEGRLRVRALDQHLVPIVSSGREELAALGDPRSGVRPRRATGLKAAILALSSTSGSRSADWRVGSRPSFVATNACDSAEVMNFTNAIAASALASSMPE